MNVYDFDKTIYKRDSSLEFYKFTLRKKPILFFMCFPKQAMAVLLYKMGMISKKHMKENFFSFLKYIDASSFVDEFIGREIQNQNIAEWYKKQQEKDDLVISASPEFIVKGFADRIGIDHVIASRIDQHNGRMYGENCYGEEKVRRFKECYKEERIEKFYSDSYSDKYMALMADKAFLVAGNKVKQWTDK